MTPESILVAIVLILVFILIIAYCMLIKWLCSYEEQQEPNQLPTAEEAIRIMNKEDKNKRGD